MSRSVQADSEAIKKTADNSRLLQTFWHVHFVSQVSDSAVALLELNRREWQTNQQNNDGGTWKQQNKQGPRNRRQTNMGPREKKTNMEV